MNDATLYEVQTQMLSGWENCWTTMQGEDTWPTTFASQEEAEQAIEEHLAEVADSVRAGDMAEEYSRDDYRVMAVTN